MNAPLAFLILLIAVVVVLLAGGVGKLRSPGTLEELAAMGVPRALRHPFLVRAHPWVEIALGVGLLVARGRPLVIASIAALVLLLGYTGLVAGAVRRGSSSTCRCFGDLVDPRLTWRSVVRNALLSALALVAMLGAVAGWSAPDMIGADPSVLLPVLAALLVSVATWAIVSHPVGSALSGEERDQATSGDDVGDYVRTPIPLAWLRDADGHRRTVRELARLQARLLVFLSPGCGACARTAADVPGWAEEFGALGVHPVFYVGRDLVEETYPSLASRALYEDDAEASRAFDVERYPAAVLLGADGLLAGGPVTGSLAIREMIDELRAEFAAAGGTSSPRTADDTEQRAIA